MLPRDRETSRGASSGPLTRTWSRGPAGLPRRLQDGFDPGPRREELLCAADVWGGGREEGAHRVGDLGGAVLDVDPDRRRTGDRDLDEVTRVADRHVEP